MVSVDVYFQERKKKDDAMEHFTPVLTDAGVVVQQLNGRTACLN